MGEIKTIYWPHSSWLSGSVPFTRAWPFFTCFCSGRSGKFYRTRIPQLMLITPWRT